MRPDMTVSIDNNDICKLLRAIDAQTKAITKLAEEVRHLRSDLVDKESLEETIKALKAERKCYMDTYLTEALTPTEWSKDTVEKIISAETEDKNDG